MLLHDTTRRLSLEHQASTGDLSAECLKNIRCNILQKKKVVPLQLQRASIATVLAEALLGRMLANVATFVFREMT